MCSAPSSSRRKTAEVHPTKAIGPNGETRTVPERVARRVWIAAGGRCTICNKYLADDEFTGQDVMVGQLAHIVGWSTATGSPRGGHELAASVRNGTDNLMLLCYDQHKVIDDKSLWDAFDVTTLRAMKRKHEARIRKLTEMSEERATTVLRVVGGIHGQPVELTEARVTTALLERDRFLTGPCAASMSTRSIYAPYPGNRSEGRATGQPLRNTYMIASHTCGHLSANRKSATSRCFHSLEFPC